MNCLFINNYRIVAGFLAVIGTSVQAAEPWHFLPKSGEIEGWSIQKGPVQIETLEDLLKIMSPSSPIFLANGFAGAAMAKYDSLPDNKAEVWIFDLTTRINAKQVFDYYKIVNKGYALDANGIGDSAFLCIAISTRPSLYAISKGYFIEIHAQGQTARQANDAACTFGKFVVEKSKEKAYVLSLSWKSCPENRSKPISMKIAKSNLAAFDLLGRRFYLRDDNVMNQKSNGLSLYKSTHRFMNEDILNRPAAIKFLQIK